jgi:hypothetical protein
MRSILHRDIQVGILWFMVFFLSLSFAACSSDLISTGIMPTSTSIVTTEVTPSITPTKIDSPTESPEVNYYKNDQFGLSFSFPPGWFGPEEYITGQELRVEIGSDVVYPYGTDLTERNYTLQDSYYIVLQFSRDSEIPYWRELYDLLASLDNGETRSDMRSLLIRVGEVRVGQFKGYEYISTLSDTAQTEQVYSRQAILFDDQSNLLVLTGSPNNVWVEDVPNWREAYQKVDDANLPYFSQVLNAILIND